MMSRTHRIFSGTSTFVVTSAVGLPLEVVAVASAGAAIGSGLPDDIEKPLHLPHREVSHYPSVQILVFGLIALAGATYLPEITYLIVGACASLALGCVMHSVADAMTVDPGGIRLLWPIRLRGYHLAPRRLRVRVGRKSFSEKLFLYVWVGFVIIYAYAHFSSLSYS
jgi:membrane-bound metal-dependent hydrolase YbcI (DUF457 family)